jgi:membrane dipeptidase
MEILTLSPQQEEQARRIHENAVVLLAHDHVFPPDDLDELRQGGITAKILLAVIDTRPWTKDPQDYERSITEIDGWFEYACGIYRSILEEIPRSPKLSLVRNCAEILQTKQDGRSGILLGAEGGKLVEYDIQNLSRLYDLGLRHILLSWAYNNQLTAGELEKEDKGLTELGCEVVVEMNRLGMLVDTTHISRRAMCEVLEISTRPVLNSHSALKSISHRIPALTEEEIRDLADHGGVIALHFMTHMLTGRFSPPAQVDELLNQVDAIVKVGGIDCMALGPDYLRYTEEHRRNTKQPNLTFPIGLETPGKMLNVTRGLVYRGYSEPDICKILGGNLMRLFQETIG